MTRAVLSPASRGHVWLRGFRLRNYVPKSALQHLDPHAVGDFDGGDLIHHLGDLTVDSAGGDDLIAAGIEEGPVIGQLIDIVRRARLDGQVKTKQEELDLAKSRLPGFLINPN